MTADAALALRALERRLVADEGPGTGVLVAPACKRVRSDEGARVCCGLPSTVGVRTRRACACACACAAAETATEPETAADAEDEGFGAADALEQRLRTCGPRAEAQTPVLAAYCALMLQHPHNTVLLSNVLRKLCEVYQNTLFVNPSISFTLLGGGVVNTTLCFSFHVNDGPRG